MSGPIKLDLSACAAAPRIAAVASWVQFEEKQFESAALNELAGGSGPFGLVFSAGQVLEAVVGYDAAAAPDPRNVVWRLLRVPRPPGIRLVPELWPSFGRPAGFQLPSTPISLVIQFKRCEHLRGPRARQWQYWHRPYFRFGVRVSQHRILRRLESRLGSRALVRYAAPAFSTYAELEAAQYLRQVLSQTGFVSPMSLASHTTWTYAEPGTMGRANPANRRTRVFESIGNLIEVLFAEPAKSTTLTTREGLPEHLRRLAGAATVGQPQLRRTIAAWRRSLQAADTGLSVATLDQVADIAAVSTVVERVGARWMVIGTPNV